MYKSLDVQNYKVRKIMACFSTNNIQMVIFNIFVSIVMLSCTIHNCSIANAKKKIMVVLFLYVIAYHFSWKYIKIRQELCQVIIWNLINDIKFIYFGRGKMQSVIIFSPCIFNISAKWFICVCVLFPGAAKCNRSCLFIFIIHKVNREISPSLVIKYNPIGRAFLIVYYLFFGIMIGNEKNETTEKAYNNKQHFFITNHV